MKIVLRIFTGLLIGVVLAVLLINWNIKPIANPYLNQQFSPEVVFDISGLTNSLPVYLAMPLTWPIILVEYSRITTGWSSDCDATGFPTPLPEINFLQIAIIVLMGVYFGSLYLLIRQKGREGLSIITASTLIIAGFVLFSGLKLIFLYMLLNILSLGSIMLFYQVRKSRKIWKHLAILIPILAALLDYSVIFLLMSNYEC